MTIGKGGIIAAGALVLASGAIGYRLTTGDGAPAENAVAADPFAILEQATRDSPDDAGAWQRLGVAYYDAGRFADAANAYGRASEADPKNAALWSSLGEALVMGSERESMPDPARAAFAKAIALDPQDPRARYFLAMGKDLDGDHQGALDDWIALLADTPQGAPWETDLVRTIEQVGKINGIDVASRMAATMGKRPAPASAGSVAIPGPSNEQLAAAGSIPPGEQRAMAEGMVAKLEARLETDPSNIDGWMMLMRSRKTLGQDAAAASALTAAIAANPSRKSELEAAGRQLGISR
ncbi:MAG: tetratricopeptide repeat protein [Tsuneonella troitsensis]